MRISEERLASEARATQFRPDMLEKVIQLIGLLNGLRGHPFLGGRIALKGGTALNLFVFNVPRLSVDVDLNYIGAVDRETMLAERPDFERAIQDVCAREGLTVRRMPHEHGGGKWRLRYGSATGQEGGLELDVNFMLRVPLWPTTVLDSQPVGSYQARQVPVCEIHELLAGKLAALLARRQARDLFDVHRALRLPDLDVERLRVAFVVYGAMQRRDWRTVSIGDVSFAPRDLEDELLPVLRTGDWPTGRDLEAHGARLVEECREALGAVLPLADRERRFLDLLLDEGVVDPGVITADAGLQEQIRLHPMLAWKALNVREYVQRARGEPESEPADRQRSSSASLGQTAAHG